MQIECRSSTFFSSNVINLSRTGWRLSLDFQPALTNSKLELDFINYYAFIKFFENFVDKCVAVPFVCVHKHTNNLVGIVVKKLTASRTP